MSTPLAKLHEELSRLLADTQPSAPATGDPLPAPVEPSTPASVCQVLDPLAKGCQLDATLRADQLVAAAELLDAHGLAMDTITGVDWIAAGQMEVVYDFFHPATWLRAALRVRVDRQKPELPSIAQVFPGANWHERETHEFFGIRFLGHPNLTPLLLPEDADYHPLRKDFTCAS